MHELNHEKVMIRLWKQLTAIALRKKLLSTESLGTADNEYELNR